MVLFLVVFCLGTGLAGGGQSDLPKVLIIGDSISIGYTESVAKLLADKADVVRPKDSKGDIINCGSSAMNVAGLDQWLGDTKWDVIHFNCGLWDVCYRHKDRGASYCGPSLYQGCLWSHYKAYASNEHYDCRISSSDSHRTSILWHMFKRAFEIYGEISGRSWFYADEYHVLVKGVGDG